MDSTDTFASCTTHPFPSQADLTAESSGQDVPPVTQPRDSNLYVNPLDDPRLPTTPPTTNKFSSPASSTNSPLRAISPKKVVLRPQAYMTDSFDDTRSTDCLLGGSYSSLQDSPLPKHRRTRFQEGTHGPFSRLLEKVDFTKPERGSQSNISRSGPLPTTTNTSFISSKPHLKSLGGSTPTGSDARKSILKNKDPETEQLIPDLASGSAARKEKSFPVKFAAFSESEGNENNRKPHKKLPSSPMPNRKIPRAPLADLMADFDGQESRGNSEENLLNDALLDHQNANTVLRCSRVNCKLNAPASNASILKDPLMGRQRIPVCMCGAAMTRVPAESVSDATLSTSLTNVSIQNTTAETDLPTEPTTSASTTEIDKTSDQRKDYFLPPLVKGPSDKMHVDSNGTNVVQVRDIQHPLSPDNLNEDSTTFSGAISSEETKLIRRSSLKKPSDS